ncbi:sensor histidine kinase [Spirilliplanes yamanashiensis]|uniref:histidine kinase n=1 Tax=Spirilliplanes yamanashiensis TaxID=42233 RepID=A0A8J4DIF7_9ACTN|nr:sensor domain-containing protein [Spirilliplanes yamanashiensis]MDP9817306.1 signal transduction histidine kinase [Spirilliplanes yamanashiensis]GIJ03042.1 histidine kinase [Spirilliplanes yamanashiensis]
MTIGEQAAGRPGAGRRYVLGRVRDAVDGLEHLVGGLATALPALAALVWLLIVALACLAGVGVLLIPSALQVARVVADRERARLSRWGPELIGAPPVPRGVRAALRDPAARRDVAWLVVHATAGFGIGLFGLTLPLYAVQSLTFPLWFRLVPPDAGGPGLWFWRVDGLPDALVVALSGIGWLAVVVGLSPGMARLQAWPGRRLLAPPVDADLSLRVAELTATRAAALDAHAAELRRIERSLHDGAQNRLVGVTVLLGAARRALTRDPAAADAALGRAQDAAEQALAELRAVARGILPPVLADRGLAGALTGLAGGCGVPCRVDVDVPGRCAASAEATAYFAVAEALTNVVRHSGATRAVVTVRRAGDRLLVRVDDDGHGGADEARGSGLAGIRRRVEAYDGVFETTSPAGGPTTMRVELPCGS